MRRHFHKFRYLVLACAVGLIAPAALALQPEPAPSRQPGPPAQVATVPTETVVAAQPAPAGPAVWVSFDPEESGQEPDWAQFEIDSAPQPKPTPQGPCSDVVPGWVPDDGGQLMADGVPLGVIREAVWLDGQRRWCDGANWLAIARCEGLNAAANWDAAYIRANADAGLFQINQIHGGPSGLLAGRWPSVAQTVYGILAAAAQLRDHAESLGLSPYQPWYKSRYCHGLG